MAFLLSVNVGSARPSDHADLKITGIDKRAVRGPVEVAAPGPGSLGGSGLAGDSVCDERHHGGVDQAVYAYAREDLDRWARELGRPLHAGMFGENLTTSGLDVSSALIGEHWQVGERVVLEVSRPRIPCRTFAGWLGERGWVKRFTERAVPGAYLRVLQPGPIQAGDPITLAHRPAHDVTVGMTFRALTTAPDLLPRLLAAQALPETIKNRARHRLPPGTD